VDAPHSIPDGRLSGIEDDSDLIALAQTPLFRAKRAKQIREILRTLRALRGVRLPLRSARGADPEVDWALQQAIRQLKKRYSATAMMEITVCGGIPPYSYLLGGKLACLMMLSPQVVQDYAERYQDEESIIASRMAGRPVVKEPTLVFLGTSSLYTQRSSQYNRVRVPVGSIPGQQDVAEYAELGLSEGFGSPGLSQETELSLQALADDLRGYRNVNFVFGEGQSGKLRQLREGFVALGLDRASLLNHGAPRIIYAAELARNTARYLLGIDREPIYRLPAVSTGAPTASISDFWSSRWLASRLDHQPALEALAQSTPLGERVTRLVVPRVHSRPQLSKQVELSFGLAEEGNAPMAGPQADERLAFIRQLYRDESAYSDHVQVSRLKELNISTGLDKVVRKAISAGASVVITGNAGDGKTHTMRLLEEELLRAKAFPILDASELTQAEVIEAWSRCRNIGTPLCIAINEGPLVDLIKSCKAEHPWLAEVEASLLNQLTYSRLVGGPAESESFAPQRGETVILDLSLRRTLSAALVRQALSKLVEDRWYQGCASCPFQAECPVTYNRTLLKEERVQRQVSTLLERVAIGGKRATFRELLGFGSFLIFGGRTCDQLVNGGPAEGARYYMNAFEGQGLIFTELNRGLDPTQQTHPQVDEELWKAGRSLESGCGQGLVPTPPRDLDEVRAASANEGLAAFRANKRRWYFENPDGRLVLEGEADQVLKELLDTSKAETTRVARLLALLNRWWNPKDQDLQEKLRLWTRLAFSPRPRWRAMVSGTEIPGPKLGLFGPKLSPALEAAFGRQPLDHVVLAPPDNLRFGSLVVDRLLLEELVSEASAERSPVVERRMQRFNDALARYATRDHFRTIEIVDPDSELRVRLRVDLNERRYDSAQLEA
jgi:hypothetical protein